ncbi:MAG TPA: SIR2 family protein [Verrucomicrobiae bacterium]|nr:SIR2 family protein [Verrucomicrobiae bacterium]
MIFSGVRLPDEVRIALEEDRLVIFVGTGVSIPPPSSLPDFNGLARQITGANSVPSGREDRALGKAARDGTNVHLAAAKILYNPRTRPTELHGRILQVFGAPDKVRVVTTNFDDHFSATSRIVYRKPRVPEYYAPALPLGDDFRGIVYLHGSARVEPRAMILTDKDFGVAYLTRGWARDFLVSLFSQYTVLFVGYSHNDVTTTYLARGLNQASVKPRWTLVSSDLRPEDQENWSLLEISVVQYPIDPSNTVNQHQSLTKFFSGWVKHARESLLNRSRRVRALAAALPPENTEVSEYLDYCLHHPQLAEDFYTAIRHPAWIGWMEDRGYFKPFFSGSAGPAVQLQPHEAVAAAWVCTIVRRKFPSLLLELIEKHHQRLSAQFAQIFGHKLWTESRRTPDPYFSTWMSILLSQGYHILDGAHWAYLLQECRIPDHTAVALRILEYMTCPEVQLQKRFDYSQPARTGKNERGKNPPRTVDYGVEWPEQSRHWLEETWKKTLQPNLPSLAEPLALLATKQLTSAHLLLRGLNRASSFFDSTSWSRSSIAEHEQDRDPLEPCLSMLIDIARDVMLHWFHTNPERGGAQIKIWWSSDVPLLRRLAIYGMASDPKLNANARLDWLLENDLIFDLGMKKEVFDVLATAYPSASAQMKRKVLRRVAKGITGKARKGLEPTTLAYEQFNTLVWLSRADPQCRLVKSAKAKIKAVHGDFGERDRPELTHWHGSAIFADPKEGFNFEKVLSEPAVKYLSFLRQHVDDPMQTERWSYLVNLAELFRRNKGWAQEFMTELIEVSAADREIWLSAVRACEEILKTQADWEWAFSVVDRAPEVPQVFAGVAHLISHGIWRGNDVLNDANTSLVGKAASLMGKAWDVCDKTGEALDETYRDWYTRAINHEGGWIGEFWIHYCSRLRRQAGTSWQGVPPTLKSKMKAALEGSTQLRVFARIAMTPWMDHVFAWDKQFAEDYFLPLLDWQRDATIAQQTWSVLLNYRRATFVEIEKQLLPYYRQLAGRLRGMLKAATEKAEQFDDHTLQNLGLYLAGLAIHVLPNPVESGFFQEFLPLLPEHVLRALALGFTNSLTKMPPERTKALWDKWLREYLDSRLVGVPVALSTKETSVMAEWCPCLGLVFPEAVARIVQMPLRNVSVYSIMQILQTSPVLTQFPKDACRYIVAVLKAEDFPSLHPSLSVVHDQFKKSIRNTPEFREFEELLYLRGWKNNPSK